MADSGRLCQFNGATFEQRILAAAGSEYALAKAKKAFRSSFLPGRVTRETQRIILGSLRSRVADGNMSADRPSIGPGKASGSPNQVAHVRRFFDFDAGDPRKWNPIIFAIEDQFKKR